MLKATSGLSKELCICNDCLHLKQKSTCEILNGEMKALPFPSTKHQRILSKMAALLLYALENKGRGTVLSAPCSVMLSPWDIVRPDLLFIRKNRSGIIGEQMIMGSPDLVVEILGRNTLERDTREKRKIYADAGIAEYWIVDPETQSVEMLIWSELGFISAGVMYPGSSMPSLLLPDLHLPLSRIFNV